MLVARDGTVESCSGAVSRMLGHDPELIEGRPLVNLVSSDDRHAVMEAIVRASHAGAAAGPVTVTVGLNRIGSPAPIPFELSFVNLVDDPDGGGLRGVRPRRHRPRRASRRSCPSRRTTTR